mmetsp:Transcript_38386/g.101541  ORF Transcript_38386/g.101541 Transcript_38386/m.101541 type:complete len:314 (-) Transcript_38386:3-944(-)
MGDASHAAGGGAPPSPRLGSAWAPKAAPPGYGEGRVADDNQTRPWWMKMHQYPVQSMEDVADLLVDDEGYSSLFEKCKKAQGLNQKHQDALDEFPPELAEQLTAWNRRIEEFVGLKTQVAEKQLRRQNLRVLMSRKEAEGAELDDDISEVDASELEKSTSQRVLESDPSPGQSRPSYGRGTRLESLASEAGPGGRSEASPQRGGPPASQKLAPPGLARRRESSAGLRVKVAAMQNLLSAIPKARLPVPGDSSKPPSKTPSRAESPREPGSPRLRPPRDSTAMGGTESGGGGRSARLTRAGASALSSKFSSKEH